MSSDAHYWENLSCGVGFNDDALGHALDRIHQKGTLKLITAENLKPLSDLLFISRFPATYHCPHDAAKALEALTRKNKNSYYHIIGSVAQTTIYASGRIPTNGQRKIIGTKYHHHLSPQENTVLYQHKLKQADC